MKRTLKYTLISAGILCLALAPLNKGEAVEPSFQTMLTYPEKIVDRIHDKKAEETGNVSEAGEEVEDITSALPEKPTGNEEESSAAPETPAQPEETGNTEEPSNEDITSAPEEAPVSGEENINIQTSSEYEKRKEARLQYIDEKAASRKTYAQIKSEIQALNPPPEPVTPAAPAVTETPQAATKETQPAASSESASTSSNNNSSSSSSSSSSSNKSSNSSSNKSSSSSSSSQTTKKAEKHSIPGQSESTSACSSSDLSTIRKYAYQNFSASKSSDLQNAAILRVNGTGSDAMDVLVDYGGEGWREYSWAEAEAKDYCIDMSDTVLKDTVGKICGYIGSYSDYSNVGVGINVTKSDGVYCITIHCVFTK